MHGQPTQPRTQFTAALTWDELGSTWYSCKGGGSWRSAILTELGQTAYNTFQKDGSTPGKRAKKPSAKLLDHLRAGGRYGFVISIRGIDDKDLLDEVAKHLAFWLELEGEPVPADDLRKQLEFIDANRLADFISTHRPVALV